MCKKDKATNKIPKGIYCYDENGKCPYWKLCADKPSQQNGYCEYLEQGDWEVDFGLLWDQRKECEINEDDEF